ncbi:MAG: sigma-70 family RNA polymerase sigma factor [Planctomycetes bacterium]|nr:sigma-70 family RNA polymerase sigma factor [Planctomycetota bacterium]
MRISEGEIEEGRKAAYEEANRILRDHHTAEDIANNAVGYELVAYSRPVPPSLPFASACRVKARCLALNELKKAATRRKAHPTIAQTAAEDAARSADEDRAEFSELTSVYSLLEGHERQPIVLLLAAAGLDDRTMAWLLGLSPRQVRYAKAGATSTLRRWLLWRLVSSTTTLEPIERVLVLLKAICDLPVAILGRLFGIAEPVLQDMAEKAYSSLIRDKERVLDLLNEADSRT